ncbi:hypothetical protein KM043_017916 [Ampulex compressa]|nr:hypothetical protein KM043_017916 [Ampulex compressa]
MSENREMCATPYVTPEAGEEVVISGIAGKFPESDNVKLLEKNLFGKTDLITDDDRRWSQDHKGTPHRTGKINHLSKFDSLFFGVHPKQAFSMDPMCRILMEQAYEAIIDAGINPMEMRGTKTAVITGCCFSEAEKTFFYEKLQPNGFGITGCNRSMLSNRIAYWLGVHGPSYTIDAACSSSLVAVEHAYNLIRSNRCDAALVGGANLCLHPFVSLQFARLGVLSTDGRCKAFDADASGYARSEAISFIFLQRAKDAKRVYATVVHAKTNSDGFKEQGITFPSSKMQGVLFEDFYAECGISPTVLSYLEAHGTGTKVGDPEEINAIERVFCKNRTTPLKIGSVKSNLGHSEPSSGLCSIAKVIIAMENGRIPPNLHFKKPREDMKAILDGRLQVVTEPTPWEGGYAGINSFGFGGVNCHILLKSHTKEKVNNGIPQDGLARLIIASGRTQDAVDTILTDVESRPVDAEFISLLHEVHATEVPRHIYRGYTIVGSKTTSMKVIQEYSGAKRPIWFVFSGMGSQWPGMGEALMEFPIFAKAIEKCDSVLKQHGLNIYDIIINKDKQVFHNIVNSFVGITAIQIGLVDLLTSVGIVPDNIIGHSVGELGCAYADGCFTPEQTILAAYSRGLASVESELIEGSMAAIGRGYNEMKDMCPPDIEIACHNSSTSCTISGPANSMKEFVAHLQANNIFAREVPCSNIAYHSRYIAPAGRKLLAYLRRVIPHSKPRSAKWVSSSVPQSEWSKPLAKFSSAEYHTNNLLSPVLFEETAALIPADAITIEIAPHGLLQAILRRSMPETVTNVPLTQRDHKNNAEMFLQSLGKLYTAGVELQLVNLYPKVEYPVSRQTPMISPIIRWEHTEDWYVPYYNKQGKYASGEREVFLFSSSDITAYMTGHVIDGRNLVPATGYLMLIWETLSLMSDETYTDVSVVFEDVKFIRATTLPKEQSVCLRLMVQPGTGMFEIVESGVAIVTGKIRKLTNPLQDKLPQEIVKKYDELHKHDPKDEPMTTKDIYKEFKLRGYQYSGLFRSLMSASIDGCRAHISWDNNWVTFLDNMLQLQILTYDSRGLFVPTAIEKLVIDVESHQNYISDMAKEKTSNGFSNLLIAHKWFTWFVPKEWTLEDAATVPCVYATAYYALYIHGKMKKGEKVLIHAGSGGVGQAAIHLALYEGCEIFTTVGTPEKRKFIMDTFPSIDDEHIGNSRNTSFEQMILQKTNGRGVDIILNSLAEDKLQASLRCLAPRGRFLEIGKFDLAANNSLGMEIFLKEISFHGVMLDNHCALNSDENSYLAELVEQGLRNGAIKPLSRKVFKKEDVESAFRYMATGKHIGKVILQTSENKTAMCRPLLAYPRFHCYSNRSYVIIGGLGGFGMELADWLVLRGAKYLTLVSRSGITNGYQRARTELWKSYGTQVSFITGIDVSTMNDCEFVLKSAEKKAPVDAIFNVAVVLKDSIFTNQTPETFKESFKPKAWATKRLDEVSRKICPKLRHFVVFSSISCGRGNAGQTNYGMSNSIMERICEKRKREGLPALAIQWGAVGQVGLLADLEKDDKTIVIGGTLQQDISSCLNILDEFLQQDMPIVSSMVVAEKRGAKDDPNNIVSTVMNIIELAQRLEEQGWKGRIILIDGSPEVMKALITQHIPSLVKEDVQDSILVEVLNKFSRVGLNSEFTAALKKCATWEDKFNEFIKNSPIKNLNASIESLKALYITVYKRLRALQLYDISCIKSIESPVLLLKPTEPATHSASPDYGLQAITRGKIEIHVVPGNHITILENEKVAAAINGEILDSNKAHIVNLMDNSQSNLVQHSRN